MSIFYPPDSQSVKRETLTVVLEDRGESWIFQIRERRADGLESGIVGREYCYVAEGVYSVDKVGLSQSSCDIAETCCDAGVGDWFWYSKNRVNNVDNAPSEILILSGLRQ